MEHVRMKVNGINIVSSEDLHPSCADCIATRDAEFCQCITDAHETITGNSTCRDKQDDPIIWKEDKVNES